jgi:hypothetical protein
MEYDISFDIKNSNMIIIRKDGKIITYIACPPIEKGCDIINFNDKINSGYTYNFDGLILITTIKERKLYYKGDLIASTKRKK